MWKELKKNQKIRILFLVRLLTAIIMSTYLAKLNIWSDSFVNSVFAVGYRVFLICTPLAFFLFSFRILPAMAFLGLVGVGLSFSHVGLVAVICVALSLAISGYLTKLFLATEGSGVAFNKVALNIGSAIAGGLIFLHFSNNVLLLILALCMLITCILALFFKLDENSINIYQYNNLIIKKDTMGWFLLGVATGIKFVAVFSVLAQYIIKHNGELPYWFGSLIIVNSIVVIFFQKYIIDILCNKSFETSIFIMIIAMLLIAFPNVFFAYTLIGATIWVALLSLFECVVTMFDKFSADNGSLIYKELAVGLGGGLAVFLAREFSEYIYLSGLVGIILIVIAYINIKLVNYIK